MTDERAQKRQKMWWRIFQVLVLAVAATALVSLLIDVNIFYAEGSATQSLTDETAYFLHNDAGERQTVAWTYKGGKRLFVGTAPQNGEFVRNFRIYFWWRNPRSDIGVVEVVWPTGKITVSQRTIDILKEAYDSGQVEIQIRRYTDRQETWGNPRGERFVEGISMHSSYAEGTRLVHFHIATATKPHKFLANIMIPADLIEKDPMVEDVWARAVSDGEYYYVNFERIALISPNR